MALLLLEPPVGLELGELEELEEPEELEELGDIRLMSFRKFTE